MGEKQVSQETNKQKVGTINGISLILLVMLTIIVLWRVLPAIYRFHQYISEDTQTLQTRIAVLQKHVESSLKTTLATDDYSLEIQELEKVVPILTSLNHKGNSEIQKDAEQTYQSLLSLLNKLDKVNKAK